MKLSIPQAARFVLFASLLFTACPADDETNVGQADSAVDTDTSTGEVTPACVPFDCDDHVACTKDYCVAGACVHATDDEACTGDEVCRPDVGCYAIPATPRCSSVDDPICNDGAECTTDKCDVASGKCTYTSNDAACADASACDGTERCAPFVGCVDGVPPTCDDEVDCTVDSCDDAAGGCVHTPDDRLCTDNVFCDGEEVCHKDVGCRENPIVPSCDDGIACTLDSCELPPIDACVHKGQDNACGLGEICRIGVGCYDLPQCTVANDPSCNDGQACTTDSCDVATGTCRFVPNHAACKDADFCDGDEQCAPFLGCVPGEPVHCDDEIACTIDVCDEANDKCAVQFLNHNACNDGVFCDGDEVCDPVVGCKDGAPRSCNDNITCTIDACEGGGCTHVANNQACGPGESCDAASGCIVTARCASVNDPICDDNQPCTTDTCDLASGRCNYQMNDALCDDQKFCNGKEVCAPFRGCLIASFSACNDGVECTVDKCNEATDSCTHFAENRLCSNEQFCDGSEVCHATQGCKVGQAPSCNDDLDCTIDSCSVADNGCKHVARDVDKDGEADKACGGLDCNDGNTDINSSVTEVCDGVDNNCDGDTDEGLLSECGNCDPTCKVDDVGGGGGPNGGFDGDGFVTVEFSTDLGGLVIQSQTLTENHLWIPNTAESTLSKWNAETVTEIGRYYVGLKDNACPGYCCWDNGCNMPSRVVVDGKGDAYVANRGFGIQGTVTKITSDLDRCVDKNNNGTIETSNSNIPLAWDEDECVSYTAAVGSVNAILRAIAIDRGDANHPEGYPWVGSYNLGTFWKLDPDTGSTIMTVQSPVRAYGAVVVANGTLYVGTIDEGAIASINTTTGEVSGRINYPSFRGCGTTYGITADRKGRLWMSGWDCQDALGYDTNTGKWTQVTFPGWGMTTGRGISVDRNGRVWMAVGGDGQSHITSWDSDAFTPDASFDPAAILTRLPNGAYGPSGIGSDAEGNIWVAHHVTSQLVRYNPTLQKMDVFTGPNRVYTYSDFTGAVRRTVIARGAYIHEIDAGCASPVWDNLSWTGEVPAGGGIDFEIRSAPTVSGLQAATSLPVGGSNPADLTAVFNAASVTMAQHARIIVNLVADDDGKSPILKTFRVDWQCPD